MKSISRITNKVKTQSHTPLPLLATVNKYKHTKIAPEKERRGNIEVFGGRVCLLLFSFPAAPKYTF